MQNQLGSASPNILGFTAANLRILNFIGAIMEGLSNDESIEIERRPRDMQPQPVVELPQP